MQVKSYVLSMDDMYHQMVLMMQVVSCSRPSGSISKETDDLYMFEVLLVAEEVHWSK